MGLMDIIGRLTGGAAGGSAPRVDKAGLAEQIRKSDLFKLLPADNIHAMIERMEPVKVKAGQEIIKQGEEGDFYALIIEGRAEVLRMNPGDKEPNKLVELSPPAAVGEDALLSNAPRNATIKMLGDGVYMRLSRDAFNEYVKEPVLTWYTSVEALQKVKAGAQWLDVREGRDHSDNLAGAIHIPMSEMRSRLKELGGGEYICYCENGRLSSTAAFILHANGLTGGVLRGGLRRMKQRSL